MGNLDQQMEEVQVAATEALPEATEASPDLTMADLAAFEDSLKSIKPGDLMKGRIVSVDREGVLVDVGYKTEGSIPLRELSHRRFDDPADIVSVGDEVEVVVVRVEEPEGDLILSKKRADLEQAWKRVTLAHENGEVLAATVIEQVKGGLIVDLGLRGFVPASHCDLRPVRDLSEFLGEEIRIKVIELDRSRRKVVLSRKKVQEEERERLKTETLDALYEGLIVEGRVARITNFGAFVNLGGIDGLIHISELSWRRIKHPSEVIKVNETVEVMVLKVDQKRERISLSLRQAKPDPWQLAADRFKVGDLVSGRVTKMAKNYVFVELADGLEGLIPLVELAEGRMVKPDEILKPDQEVTVKIIDMKLDQRRITLSLRQAQEGLMGRETSGYLKGQQNGSFTVGDLLKAKMQELPVMSDQKAPEPAPLVAEAQGAGELEALADLELAAHEARLDNGEAEGPISEAEEAAAAAVDKARPVVD